MTAISPIAEFTLKDQHETTRTGPVRWVFSHTIRQWPVWLVALTGAIVNAVMASIGPLLIGQAFNAILATPPKVDQLAGIALLLVATQASRGLIQLARNFGFEVVAQRIERDVRNELYTSLLGKSMTFHSLQPVGDTMARATNDVREVNFAFSPGVSQVFSSLTFLIMPVIVAPRLYPSLVITPIIFIVLYVIALRNYLRTLEPITDEVRLSFGELNTRLSEALDGIETVKGAAQEDREVGLFQKNARRYRNAAVRQGDVEARFIPMLLLGLAYGFGLLHALYLFSQGLLDVGSVVAYFGLLLMLDFPTFTSMWAYSRIALGMAGARRILDLMNRENNVDQNLAGFTGPMRGEIEFRDVSFAYTEGDNELEHISFTVKPGQRVAIVGQTGSGKTSLIRLINRTYDTSAGQVLVDGVDVRDWNLEALRRNVSIIEQDVFLFSRSIAENIAFGRPDSTQAEIESAAHAAQAHEFIETFEKGYQTVVGDRGVTLSGGQRQRLALARAFLTGPRILVLDDSTSAIDSATEDKIQKAIFHAARGRTTFIITHRLSQIRWADLIIVLRQGKISAIGSHSDLLATSEAYRRIFTEK
jgi:ATP-binding cassette, subfamily B, bacterial